MRYFFHLHECGVVTRDADGAELIDLAAAQDLAIREARIVMCTEIKLGHLCLSCHIEIADVAGTILATVPFRDAVTVIGGGAAAAAAAC